MLFWGTESAIQSHSGLRECSSEGDGIKSLCANGESLEQVRCFPRIAGDDGYAATQLYQELTACAVDGAQRFDSHRDKIVSGRKVRIFASFSVRSVLCCASRRYRRQVDIGGRARVNGCCVSSNILAPRPRNESSSSGLLPSFRIRPGGSFELGTYAFTRALQMMSFTAKWRAALPVDRLQTSPWWPPESAVSPQWHWCGAQSSSPSRSPTATRTASLLRPIPHEATGIVRSQSPECGDDTAPSLAWLRWSLLDDHTAALSMAMRGLSQTFWLVKSCSSSVGFVDERDSRISSRWTSLHSTVSRTALTRDLVEAAEAM